MAIFKTGSSNPILSFFQANSRKKAVTKSSLPSSLQSHLFPTYSEYAPLGSLGQVGFAGDCDPNCSGPGVATDTTPASAAAAAAAEAAANALNDSQNRTVGIITLAGDNIILPAQHGFDSEIDEVTIQPTAAVTAQIKTSGNQILSGAFQLAALEKWSAPGILVSKSSDLIVNLSTATPCVFEVRWRQRLNS